MDYESETQPHDGDAKMNKVLSSLSRISPSIGRQMCEPLSVIQCDKCHNGTLYRVFWKHRRVINSAQRKEEGDGGLRAEVHGLEGQIHQIPFFTRQSFTHLYIAIVFPA